jgi:hypothetical protein
MLTNGKLTSCSGSGFVFHYHRTTSSPFQVSQLNLTERTADILETGDFGDSRYSALHHYP